MSRGKVRVASCAWGPGEFLAPSERAGVSAGTAGCHGHGGGGGPGPRTRAGGTGPELRGASRMGCVGGSCLL